MKGEDWQNIEVLEWIMRSPQTKPIFEIPLNEILMRVGLIHIESFLKEIEALELPEKQPIKQGLKQPIKKGRNRTKLQCVDCGKDLSYLSGSRDRKRCHSCNGKYQLTLIRDRVFDAKQRRRRRHK
jgi:hypothetical protein